MSTREETKQTVFKHMRITKELDLKIEKLDINFSDTCRKALEKEVERLEEDSDGRTKSKRSR